MIKTILCPSDGSDHAARAVKFAIDLAKRYDARLVLAHVLLRHADADELRAFAEVEGLTKTVAPEVRRLMDVDSRVEVARLREVKPVSSAVLGSIGEKILGGAKWEAKHQGIAEVETVMLDGDPAKRILELAERENVDCIVLGGRGLGDIRSRVLGSVSHKIANQARCTCITVK